MAAASNIPLLQHARLKLPMQELSTYGKPLRRLGTGGLGKVDGYGYVNEAGRNVIQYAVKTTLKPENGPASEDIKEVATAVYVGDHPNILKLIDAGFEVYTVTTPTQTFKIPLLFSVYEIMDGDAAALVNLPNQEKRNVFLQMAIAIDYIAQLGVVHRDIKPTNFLYKRNHNGTYSIKLGDFGKNRAGQCSYSSGTVSLTYTIGYMAPEGLLGGEMDSVSDVWALGMTFFYIMEGASLIQDDPSYTEKDYYGASIKPTMEFIGAMRPHETLKEINTALAKTWVPRINTYPGYPVDVGDNIMNDILERTFLVDGRPHPEQLLDYMCSVIADPENKNPAGTTRKNSIKMCSEALGMRYSINCTQQLQICENFDPMFDVEELLIENLATGSSKLTGEGAWGDYVNKLTTFRRPRRVFEHAMHFFLKSLREFPTMRGSTLVNLFQFLTFNSDLTNDAAVALTAVGFDIVYASVSDYSSLFRDEYSEKVADFYITFVSIQLTNRDIQMGFIIAGKKIVEVSQYDVALCCYFLACMMANEQFKHRVPTTWKIICEQLINTPYEYFVRGTTSSSRQEIWERYLSGLNV